MNEWVNETKSNQLKHIINNNKIKMWWNVNSLLIFIYFKREGVFYYMIIIKQKKNQSRIIIIIIIKLTNSLQFSNIIKKNFNFSFLLLIVVMEWMDGWEKAITTTSKNNNIWIFVINQFIQENNIIKIFSYHHLNMKNEIFFGNPLTTKQKLTKQFNVFIWVCVYFYFVAGNKNFENIFLHIII